MSTAVRCLAEPVKTLAFGSISGSYAPIGTATEHPARIIVFQNQTNATVMFSLDGVNDHFPLLSEGYFVLDLCSNKAATASEFYISTGTIFFVKQIGVVGSGSVYVSVFYGEN